MFLTRILLLKSLRWVDDLYDAEAVSSFNISTNWWYSVIAIFCLKRKITTRRSIYRHSSRLHIPVPNHHPKFTHVSKVLAFIFEVKSFSMFTYSKTWAIFPIVGLRSILRQVASPWHFFNSLPLKFINNYILD